MQASIYLIIYASAFQCFLRSEIISMENLTSYTSLHRQFVLDSLNPTACQGQTCPSPSVLEEIMILFTWNRIAFSISRPLFFPHLYLSTPPHPPTPTLPPPVSWTLLVLPPRWRCSIAPSQRKRGMRDESKPPYFPSVPFTVPDWIWGFSSSFSSFSFPCLPWRPLSITWNQAVSQLDDAVSFVHMEGDSGQPSLLVLFIHFKSTISVGCVQKCPIPKSIRDPALHLPVSYKSPCMLMYVISFPGFNVQTCMMLKHLQKMLFDVLEQFCWPVVWMCCISINCQM